MPETFFSLRWPDGSEMLCYSPSTVVETHFAAGASYPIDAFLTRSRDALHAASERVRQRFGFPCSRALGQLAEIERMAGSFVQVPDAAVTVLGFHRDQS